MKYKEIEGDRRKAWEQIYQEAEAYRATSVLSIYLNLTYEPFIAKPFNLEISDLLEMIQELDLDKLNKKKFESRKNVLNETYEKLILDPKEKCTLLIIETAKNQHFNVHINQSPKLFVKACDRALADNF